MTGHADGPHSNGAELPTVAVPVGLVLLVGPPASGKSSFAQACVRKRRIDPAGIVSCDLLRGQLFGEEVHSADDPALFEEMHRRVSERLAQGHAVVVDATNVSPHARSRMTGWARQDKRPTSALRFVVDDARLVERNLARRPNRYREIRAWVVNTYPAASYFAPQH